MPGARCTRSLVRKSRKRTSKSSQVRRTVRHSLRDGSTVSFVISPVIGLSCHRHQRDAQASSPARPQRREVRTTRLRRPLHRHSSVDDIASIASRTQQIVTIAKRPSHRAGRREMICPTGGAKYLLRHGWTVESALTAFAKFEFSRNVLSCRQAMPAIRPGW